MRTTASGPDWRCNAGDTVDLPDQLAEALLDEGYAEEADTEPQADPEPAPAVPAVKTPVPASKPVPAASKATPAAPAAVIPPPAPVETAAQSS